MNTFRSTVSIVKGDIQESPFQYSEKDLTAVRKMMEQSLDLIGGLQPILGAGRTVVVKPNLVEIPFETTGGSVVTDPRVLEALVLVFFPTRVGAQPKRLPLRLVCSCGFCGRRPVSCPFPLSRRSV